MLILKDKNSTSPIYISNALSHHWNLHPAGGHSKTVYNIVSSLFRRSTTLTLGRKSTSGIQIDRQKRNEGIRLLTYLSYSQQNNIK